MTTLYIISISIIVMICPKNCYSNRFAATDLDSRKAGHVISPHPKIHN